MKQHIPIIDNYAQSNGQVHSYLAFRKVEKMAIEKGIDKQVTLMIFGHMPINKLNQIINEPWLLAKYQNQKVNNPSKFRAQNRSKYTKRKAKK